MAVPRAWTRGTDQDGEAPRQTLTTLPEARALYWRSTTWAGTIKPAHGGHQEKPEPEYASPLAVCWCGSTYVDVAPSETRRGLTRPCRRPRCQVFHRMAYQAQRDVRPLPAGFAHGAALDSNNGAELWSEAPALPRNTVRGYHWSK